MYTKISKHLKVFYQPVRPHRDTGQSVWEEQEEMKEKMEAEMEPDLVLEGDPGG